MRVVIIIAILALIVFAYINYLVYSNYVVLQYNKALKMAGDKGFEAAAEEYDQFKKAGSWTTIFLVPKLEDQWLEDLADLTLNRATVQDILLTEPQDICAADCLTWFEKHHADWPQMPKLIDDLAKTTFEKGKAFVSRPLDALLDGMEIRHEKQLATFARRLAKSQYMPKDKGQKLLGVAQSLEARIPADEKRLQEYLDSLPKTL